MRKLPFSPRKACALVPLAVAVALAPFALDAFAARAGADTAGDCAAAFTAAPAAPLDYTTVPAARLAQIGQTVELSGRWDPSAWDGLTSAEACVQLNDAFDDALGTVTAAPANTGAFDHSFVVPVDVPDGSTICTRIRLAGDPAGPATEAVWVSKTHCFEIDTSVDDVAPPGDTTPTTTATTTSTTTTSPTTPPVQPAITPGAGADTPPASPSTPAAGPAAPGGFAPEGGGAAPGTPVDEVTAPPTSPSPAPTQAAGTSARAPVPAPALPATGFTSAPLLHAGRRSLSIGLALLVLFGWPRRRRSQA
jgi:hypothetical protein